MEITASPQLALLINTAAKAGCPRDQLEELLSARYIPYPWQLRFHAAAREADQEGGPVDIGVGGARGPGKSHAVLSQAALDDCHRMPRLKVLFLRQTGNAAQESFDDLIDKAVRGRARYHKTKNSLRFPNGSKILLGGFKDESDIDKYVGIEYDIIIVEELNQLTSEKYAKLRGSLRTSKPNWRPRMYTSFNPGGVGHTFVRDRYVIPFREKKEKETRFIPSTYKENPALNSGYIEYLEGLGGDLGKAWREGEWDLFAGQYFSEWRYERHVVKPFTIPATWRRFRSIDPSGRDGITSCHWYALDSDGRVWVYREYYYGIGVIDKKTGLKIEVGRDYDEHARAIKKLSEDEGGAGEDYLYTVIDTAAFSKAGYSETAAQVFERNGVTGLIPAAKERVTGWNSVHTYLRWDMHTRPKLQVFETCDNMIRTVPALQHDERVPEDVDSRGEDHAADELRYILRTLHEGKSPKPLTLVEKRIAQLNQLGRQDDYSYSRN